MNNMAVAAKKIEREYVCIDAPGARVYARNRAATMEAAVHEPVYVHRGTRETSNPAVRPKIAPAPQVWKKLLCTFGIMAVAAVLLLMLVRYAAITEQYSVINDMKTTIVESQRNLAELKVKLNSAVTLEEARDAALSAGMSYPAADQIVKIK